MSKELVKKTFSELVKTDSVIKLANLDEFNVLINQNPPAKWIKTNPYANNSKYLPIDKVEFLLRKIFKDVDIEVLREGVMFNAVTTTVRVHYTHPVTGVKGFKDGVGASQIQTKKGSSPADMANINNGAVEMALPKAKTAAIKDACDNLGRIFGSDLNRKDVIEVTIDENLQDKKYQVERERILEAIKNGHKPTDEEVEHFKLNDETIQN